MGCGRRADVGIGPYGGTGGALGGRPQGSLLRKRYMGCDGRATARVAPTKGLQGVRCAGRRGRRPLRKGILWCVGEGLSCPPLCRPIPGHCRARQSGHFLETGLLHPPLAALRRFPLPRATARVAPTEALHGVRCKIGGRGRTPPLRRVTRSACVRGRAAALHQGSFLQRSSVLWTTWATLWPRPG